MRALDFRTPLVLGQEALTGTYGSLTYRLSKPPEAQSQACSFTVAANFDDGDHFTGTYTTFNCALLPSGGLDMHRQ